MTGQAFRLLEAGGSGAYLNMAIDEAVFRSVASGSSPGTLRFYGWRSPAVSLGHSQVPGDVLDLRECAMLGIEVVRRPTGGGAILHGDELTYSISAPADGLPFGGNLMEVYRMISGWIASGLRGLGVDAVIQPEVRGFKQTGACFLRASSYELTARGRKIAGSAQRRTREAFLQHGSIPFSFDTGTHERIFRGLETGIMDRTMTSVRQETGTLVKPVRLAAMLAATFTEFFDIVLKESGLTAAEAQEVEKLLKNKHLQSSRA
jgi:lipoate-protein ligase A